MHIKYTVYPDDPQATERARSEAKAIFILGFFAFWSSIGAIPYFVYRTVLLYTQGDFAHFAISIAFLLLAALLDFFFVWVQIPDKEDRRYFTKRYFLFFIGGTLAAIGIITMIMGFCGYGGELIACAIIGMIVLAVVIWIIYMQINAKENSYKLRFFTRQEDRISSPVAVAENEINFCHKCGEKLMPDSVFCSNCGTQVKKD